MALLQITNTGRLNYHLKALGALVSKDEQGKYRLTERGKLAANMLKTFPERVPPEKKKRSAIKIVASTLLILMGVLLIFSTILFVSSVPTSASDSYSTSTVYHRAISQNTTVYLNSLIVSEKDSQLKIDWSASNPVYIYILNTTQYDSLLLQDSTNAPAYSMNFTGMPSAYLSQYDSQNGSVSMSVSQGKYYFYAGCTSNATVNSFSFALHQPPVPRTTEYLLAAIPSVFGILMVALAVLILRQRE